MIISRSLVVEWDFVQQNGPFAWCHLCHTSQNLCIYADVQNNKIQKM